MVKLEKRSKLYPGFIADSVLDISIAELKRAGITHLVLDVDETLVPMRQHQLTDDYVRHLNELQEAGIVILIGSNSLRDLSAIADPIGANVVLPGRIVFKP